VPEASQGVCVRMRGREVGSRVGPEHEVALIHQSQLSQKLPPSWSQGCRTSPCSPEGTIMSVPMQKSAIYFL
jgi:hypothetical protein